MVYVSMNGQLVSSPKPRNNVMYLIPSLFNTKSMHVRGCPRYLAYSLQSVFLIPHVFSHRHLIEVECSCHC